MSLEWKSDDFGMQRAKGLGGRYILGVASGARRSAYFYDGKISTYPIADDVSDADAKTFCEAHHAERVALVEAMRERAAGVADDEADDPMFAEVRWHVREIAAAIRALPVEGDE